MSRRRLVVLTAGVAFWCVAAWLGVRGAGFLWRKLSSGHLVSSRGSAALPGGKWSASEREAIERAVRPGYRPAVAADAASTPERDDLLALYGRYDPFFVRGDLDDDGRPDFVQAFVREREGEVLFDVAVFFGLEGGGYSAPVFVERGVALNSGDLTIDRTLVIVTPDLADDEAYRYRFDPETRKFVDVDAGAGSSDDDAPEQAPDQRLRIRV
jgi:hypothetical protein